MSPRMSLKVWMALLFLLRALGTGLPAAGAATPAVTADPPATSVETLLRQSLERSLTRATAEEISRVRARRLDAAEAEPPAPAADRGVDTGCNCFPTCDAEDGRFLVIANGAGLVTLSDTTLAFELAVPAGTESFRIGVFDGDGGELDGAGDSHWDVGMTAPFAYSLYADPAADCMGTTPVELLPGMTTVTSDMLPDNDWFDFTITTGSEALTPGGHYFYHLRIELLDTGLVTLNAFKLRASGVITLEVPQQPFSYIANCTSLADIVLIYPNFPEATETTYDGTFRFYLDVPQERDEVHIWDGDFDRGKFDGTDLDSDDPDTPNAPYLPPWATVDACAEGVAVGDDGLTGNPPDDADPAGFGIYAVRSPSVRYGLIFPDGQIFLDENPSGNQEWERFRVATGAPDPAEADFAAERVPPGVYEVLIEGVDMQNLNALWMPSRLLCVTEEGDPCVPLRPFAVGDTVFIDVDGDGNQGPGEPGVGDVLVRLRDPYGNVLATAVTAGDGGYRFEVHPGTYTVDVAPSNFAPGGMLRHFVTTTGNSLTDTVIDANRMDYDFGYRRACPPGTGTLGFWKTHPGVWPVTQVPAGGVLYTRAEAIALMNTPGGGDKTYDLFKQYVAAWLNVLVGNEASCVTATLEAADAWLAAHPPGSGVKGRDAAWRHEGAALHATLDAYNNGLLCAPHRS